MTQTITSTIAEINAHDAMMNTVLGLLAKGDINCAGSELPLSNDLFASQQRTVITPETLEQRRARQASETPAGVIRTAEEVRRAEEEALRKKEEEERQAREKAEEEARMKREEEERQQMIASLTPEQLEAAGIYQNTIRLSIGTEHIDDIIADLEKGFAAI